MPLQFGIEIYNRLLLIGDKLAPLSLLGLRLWIANIFWKSGLTKIANWESTKFLFREEYQVPLLPPELAAIMATTGELVAPILLVFGIAGRFGAAALLVMTAVIELTYLSHSQHIIWALVLVTIFLHGPGKFSIDYLISRRLLPNRHETKI